MFQHQVAENTPPDHQQSFKRNEFGRQIIGRSKTNRMVSSSSEFSFTQVNESSFIEPWLMDCTNIFQKALHSESAGIQCTDL